MNYHIIQSMNKLSPQAIKKLNSMSEDEKIHLLARIIIMRQNSQISGLLSREISYGTLGYAKAEIVHQLYDGNGRNKQRFNNLMGLLSDKNPYDYFDTYTLCAYVYYFGYFLHNMNVVRTIKEGYQIAGGKAYQLVDDRRLCIGQKTSFGSLLAKNNRDAVKSYLMKDLKIFNEFKAIESYLKGEKVEQKAPKYSTLSHFYAQSNEVYANQVERYVDENGKPYYLDMEGNLIDCDEIKDYHMDNLTVHATKRGLVTYEDDEQKSL